MQVYKPHVAEVSRGRGVGGEYALKMLSQHRLIIEGIFFAQPKGQRKTVDFTRVAALDGEDPL
jgi:hypothetical protein